METYLQILLLLLTLEHLYIMYLEMFAWETKGPKVFKGALAKELFKPTRVLAANQGLYNGFLAAGLFWPLLIDHPEWKWHVALFFLGCVSIAGIYGALTATKKIFWIQAFPALVTLLLVLVHRYI